jgi:hypothetical protein
MLRNPIKTISTINNVQERKLDQQNSRWMICIWHVSECDVRKDGILTNMVANSMLDCQAWNL